MSAGGSDGPPAPIKTPCIKVCVVDGESGLPAGYESNQMHPELRSNERVMDTSHALQGWLAETRAEPTSH